MANEFVLVHISDLHARGIHSEQIAIRTKSFHEDLARIGKPIDAVVFSGDLAFSGDASEYTLAEKLLLTKLSSRFYVSKENIIIVPGNHDVQRRLVDPVIEAGLRTLMTNSAKAASHRTQNPDRLSSYYDFLKQYKKVDWQPFYTRTVLLNGVNVGFAALDSAWRCSGDDDQHHLFLTETAVHQAANAIEGTDLKIAVLHHPMDWYHSSEREIVQADLKRRFDIILSGHLHVSESLRQETPSHNCLEFTTPALFEGKIKEEGYNYYIIDYENRKLEAHFRKYFRRRDAFDKDTEHAQDGCHRFPLPISTLALATHATTVLVQRLTKFSEGLLVKVQQQLRRFQNSEDPVIVRPKIIQLTRKTGITAPSTARTALSDIYAQNSVLIGASESGKSILLQSLCAELNASQSKEQVGSVSAYVDFRGFSGLRSEPEIVAHIRRALSEFEFDENATSIKLFCDHVDEREITQIEVLRAVASANNWTLIVTLSSKVLIDAISANSAFSDFELFQLQQWGPSRIREFIKKVIPAGEMNIEAAYNFVTRSLRDTDIPSTPVVVALYLSVFPSLGNQVSSLSFLRLLEKLEQIHLESKEISSSYSLYNKREILMKLACMCMDVGSLTLPRATVEAMITEYFGTPLLPVNIKKFLAVLEESRLVIITETSVAFSYYAFYDYYLAKAFEKGLVSIEHKITSLEECVTMGRAIELHGGLIRENPKVINNLLEFIENSFEVTKEFSLADLDSHIKSLLTPLETESVDKVATRHVEAQVDYESYDTEHANSHDSVQNERKSRMKLTKPENEFEGIALRIEALKTFYNLFRNLENLGGSEKIRLLDRILDSHVSFNLSLMGFFSNLLGDSDFQTLTGYAVTMGGQVFLTANVANESLQQTIAEAISGSTNDFKKLLLICLYSDMRLRNYTTLLTDFLGEVTSPAGIEILYHRITHILVHYDERELPLDLLDVFKLAFKKRQLLYGGKTNNTAFSKAFEETMATRRLLWG